jgi:hypothetical protein
MADEQVKLIDISKCENWPEMVKTHKLSTDERYYNYFQAALMKLMNDCDCDETFILEKMIEIHHESENPHGKCLPFLQMLPSQDVYEQFVLLLPGHPQSSQNRTWLANKTEGVKRLRKWFYLFPLFRFFGSSFSLFFGCQEHG